MLLVGQARLLRQLARAGLGIVPTWHASVSQWDVHLERRSAHTRARGIDCTHLCEPSGVLEAWTDALLVTLEERAKARSSIQTFRNRSVQLEASIPSRQACVR